MNINDAKLGQLVIYTPPHALGDINHEDAERGKISSVNKHYIFVNFDYSETSKACYPDSLTVL